MSKNTDSKKGLALGAIFGLLASAFVGILPAKAANEFIVTPTVGTSFNTLVTEDLSITTTLDPTSGISDGVFESRLKYHVAHDDVSSWSLVVLADSKSSSGAVTAVSTSYATAANYAGQTLYYNGGVHFGGNTSMAPEVTYSVVVPQAVNADGNNVLSMYLLGGTTSISNTVTVTVTAFLDNNSDNKFDATIDNVYKVQVVKFLSYASVAPTLTVGAVEPLNTYLTVSAAVSGINFSQLGGKWVFHYVEPGQDADVLSFSSVAGASEIALTDALAAAGHLSQSAVIPAATAGNTWSVAVRYYPGGAVSDGAGDYSFSSYPYYAFAATKVTVARAGASNVRIANIPSANLAVDGSARPNATYTVRVGARTQSDAVSASGVAVTYTFGGTSLSTTKTISVNGGLAATTSHGSVVVTTGANGNADAVITAAGFNAGETIAVTASAVGFADVGVLLTMDNPEWTLTNAADLLATRTSTAVDATVTVTDQWNVNSSRTDQRIKFTKSGFDFGSNTVSYGVVSAGVATSALVPTALSGSMTVALQLQTLNQNTGLYDDTSSSGDSSITVTVTDAASTFRTGLAASYSASISYGTDLSWSSTIDAAYVTVTGSTVVVSGAGLMFRDANLLTSTASDSLTLVGNSNARVQFQVTARLAGTYTVTLTSGAATTTSLIIVNAARSDMGTTITWDTTAIEAGKTKIVTGTLTDANGNPVYTDGPGGEGDVNDSATTASILVTYAGTAGIPVGSMPTETDADGKFRISVLTSGSDEGSFTLTAAYSPDGTATAAADKVTSINTITVGDNVEAVDQKITVGSFKGYIAIYTKGYMGQKLSAKVAGKWLVVDPIAAWQGNDYSRVVRLTGAGYTILVHLYIDGAFVRSETIVTK